MEQLKKIQLFRRLAIILVFISLCEELFGFIYEAATVGVSYSTIGFIFFSSFLHLFLVYFLLVKKTKGVAFLLACLKVYDSVSYSQLFLIRLEEKIPSSMALTIYILFGSASLILFASFVFFMIERIHDYKWAEKAVYYSLLVASVVMLVTGIMQAATHTVNVVYLTRVFEPFAAAVLFLGLYFGGRYVQEVEGNKNE